MARAKPFPHQTISRTPPSSAPSCGEVRLDELLSGFRFNDAVLRHLVIKRDQPVTKMSAIMKNRDDKGERRRRDDEGGYGMDDSDERPSRSARGDRGAREADDSGFSASAE